MKISRRRAIDMLLAEVIVVAITVVAGLALAVYALSFFGRLDKVAEITPVSTRCFSANSTCIVELSNPGAVSASADSCSLSGQSGEVEPVFGTVLGGATLYFSCQASSVSPTPGAQVYGKFLFSNGEPVTFAGVWNS